MGSGLGGRGEVGEAALEGHDLDGRAGLVRDVAEGLNRAESSPRRVGLVEGARKGGSRDRESKEDREGNYKTHSQT